MQPPAARLTLMDRLIQEFDRGLRTVAAANVASRPKPAGAIPESVTDPVARRHAAGRMRGNHAGEIAAQALYHGQASFARQPEVQDLLLQAAREEADHLAWCDHRLRELGSRPSLLSPLWYAGSFAIGAAAALVGDRVSLGFVTETERQVEGHINDHLERLPAGDERSRAILKVMREDEVAHGAAAREAGGVELPQPMQLVMRATAKVMTRTSYWI
jgi:ubiquinone biosynthesis monooxygenase Coq7